MKSNSIIYLCILICTSFVTSAQSKKEMREKYHKMQEGEKRIKTLTQEALNGNAASSYELGMMYYDGNITGVKRDSAEKYFDISQKGGYPEALYKFGQWNQFGAAYWPNDRFGHANRSEAIRYYKLAADKGYQPAIDILKQYENKDNLIQQADVAYSKADYNETFRLLKMAADLNNDSLAMYKISQMYLQHRLNTSDDNSNSGGYSSWLWKAAERKYKPAFMELAFLYEKEGSLTEAQHWFYVASMYGDKLANEKYDGYRKFQLQKEKEQREKIVRENVGFTAPSTNSNNNSNTAKHGKKTCPFCAGRGSTTTHETFVDGRYDKNNVKQFGQTTKLQCTLCKGTGYVNY